VARAHERCLLRCSKNLPPPPPSPPPTRYQGTIAAPRHSDPASILRVNRYDTSTQFYASKTFLDSRPSSSSTSTSADDDDATANTDRRVLWGWLFLFKSAPESPGGWQGGMSAPRVVEAASDGRSVVTYPIPELATLRDTSKALTTTGLTLTNASATLLGLRGTRLDVEATITFTQALASNRTDGMLDMMPGTDLPGGDYSVYIDAAYTDPSFCEAACAADDKCKAWT